ncbi:Aste57867_20185 [Aphanomyces stellatus]|uniref:Aste57867_20185 protein n=1 Tax=Aphanomyces stellatus TaxID=120398 RepID=A0A485LEJ1_9STRA|nr:hypothetical protein As57867_020119 [Aphanomyces stellatus]VFT96879.1 Aste57867_20185 [Aphanomyces stellatus]
MRTSSFPLLVLVFSAAWHAASAANRNHDANDRLKPTAQPLRDTRNGPLAQREAALVVDSRPNGGRQRAQRQAIPLLGKSAFEASHIFQSALKARKAGGPNAALPKESRRGRTDGVRTARKHKGQDQEDQRRHLRKGE